MRRANGTVRSQHGVALLLVLWACTLLAILLGGYAALARTEGLQARYQFAHARAHYAAEAGMMRAFYGLQDSRSRQRWIGDGRVYTFHYNGAVVKVSALGEGGKIDLNTASPEILRNLFQLVGMTPAAAKKLADSVIQWRSPILVSGDRETRSAAYRAAGLDYGPRNGPFASIEELQLVLGMPPAIYRKIAGAITIWSGNTSPDPNTAPLLALRALPGMTAEKEKQILAARVNNANDPRLVLNNGTTHSIRSEAMLADGTRALLRATIRLQSGQNGSQPYAVLRWQEGETQ